MFAYRGIFGGYPGITTIEPYYDKIKLYSHLENRDLWEYQLNLTQQETAQLLRAAWEVKDKRFDYYFFDENCSYRILALLDIARPGTQLLDSIQLRAIPSDTVRLVMQKNLVANIRYRASSSTDVAYKLKQLPAPSPQLLLTLLKEGLTEKNQLALASYEPIARVNLLDTTFDFLRFQAIDKDLEHDDSAKLSHRLLIERSQLTEKSDLLSPPKPKFRDDQGHETLRLSLGMGQFEQDDYIQFGIRPAYHDLSDPTEGYQAGAQLQFLRTDFRYYPDPEKFQVEQLTAIEIMSLSPRDQFFNPTSWQVGIGGRRVLAQNTRIFTPYLEGGSGLSYPFLGGISYGLVTADVELSSKITKGFNIGPGAVLAWVYQGAYWQTHLGAKSIQFLDDGHHQRNSVFISQSFTPSKSWSVNLSFKREDDDGNDNNTWGAEARYYY